MPSVRWPDATLLQLDDIVAYIEQRNPQAAERMRERLLALGNSLTTFPLRGKLTSSGARQLVTVKPYILRYRIDQDEVIIIGIRHSARRPLD